MSADETFARTGREGPEGTASGSAALGRMGTPNPTPARVLAQLATLPDFIPVRHDRLPEELDLGAVISGDLIALNGRWTQVLGCTCVNGWVTVETPQGTPNITAHESTRAHFARKWREPAGELATWG